MKTAEELLNEDYVLLRLIDKRSHIESQFEHCATQEEFDRLTLELELANSQIRYQQLLKEYVLLVRHNIIKGIDINE